ncbi:1-phosphatidylinositol-3-phosphate 5-kinase [Niveomyces insectorum RCEF 264]|uniref:Mitochondrial distribution and morphology protein 12 n=1 Tax=Niveomyces insectorum RCEF 264 TaxID=1081102 RepID=A0A167UZG7_9HYPO|nr:1-phosphatidylinositol-3-phosphate 5-kinase [Niveomyces insectorum RCEF 264]
MSIDLNWETLTTGPDGEELAHRIRDFIHSKFQTVPLPRFIKSVTVHDFEFGTVPPELALKDITDPLPDFYEENEDVEDDEDEEGADEEGDGDDDLYHNETGGDGYGNNVPQRRRDGAAGRHRHDLSGSSFKTVTNANVAAAAAAAAAAASTPTSGVPGGTSNLLHHFHSHLTPGWSGTHTPLAAVAGAHRGPGGGDYAYRGAGGSNSRPPTRDATTAALLAGSAVEEDDDDGGGGDMERTLLLGQAAGDGHGDGDGGGPFFAAASSGRPRPRREPRAEDLQAVFRIRYAGDIKLLLTADILLDYPMPSFVGIPVRLSITGLTFDGVGVLAYIRRRVHFCFLSPEDALAAVGDEEEEEEEEEAMGIADGAHGRGAAAATAPRPRTKLGGLLQEVRVESEIGQRAGGKQSLKNVGKVERFVLEQVRRIFEEEFVYPSFWTFLV